MNHKFIDAIPEFHETALEEITFTFYNIIVLFDDVDEQRWKLKFSPYQGIKVTTGDCVKCDFPGWSKMVERENSLWVEELKNNLTDRTATFMDKAHHYILPFQNIVLEIVAWDNYVLEKFRQMWNDTL